MTAEANTIARALMKLGTNSTTPPDERSNSGQLMATAFLWDEVKRFATAKAKDAWDNISKNELIPDPSSLPEGDHQLAQSSHFAITARITAPAKRFNEDELAKLLLHSKHKVPLATTKDFIAKAKLPGNPIKTLRVIERV